MAYTLQKSITNNITKESKNKFLRQKKLIKEFTEKGMRFEDFIMNSIKEEKISITEVNEYLFNELFFGQQRDTFIYKVYSYKREIEDVDKLIDILKNTYGIEDVYVVRIADVYTSDKEANVRELVGCQIIRDEKNRKVKKIKLLFSEKVEIQLKDGTGSENSYIPIEIDIENKLLIAKISPKSKVLTEGAIPEELYLKYVKKVKRLFDLEFESFNTVHRETMYKMCKHLYFQVYSKMVFNKPNGIEKTITEVSSTLNNVLNIENLELKKKYNNIFNIQDNITKIIEHLLISDILFSTSDNEVIEGIDGYVTYLKFNDGNNVSARLKGENCMDSIFDSETFMALRYPIDNSKKISILKVVWFCYGKKLRTSYDASSSLSLNIHFYKDLTEEEFNYALNKYWQYERTPFERIEKMDSIHANKVAEQS